MIPKKTLFVGCKYYFPHVLHIRYLQVVARKLHQIVFISRGVHDQNWPRLKFAHWKYNAQKTSEFFHEKMHFSQRS